MEKDALIGIAKATVLTTIMTRLEMRSMVGKMPTRSMANAIAASVCDVFLAMLPPGTFVSEARLSIHPEAMAEEALRALGVTFEED